MPTPGESEGRPLCAAVTLSAGKIHNPDAPRQLAGLGTDAVVLVILAAGRGTRFGPAPKCVQPVHGRPLARHSIEAFRQVQPMPVVCVIGHAHESVAAALGTDVVYVRSQNPTGGTALAAFEALSVPALLAANPRLVVSMGDRVVPASTFRRLIATHGAGDGEADLTFLSAIYAPPTNQGKGRVVRDARQRVQRIVEQRDIDAEPDPRLRDHLHRLTEGNCPLYAVRARTLHRCLAGLTNANAQEQYYLTDMVEVLSRAGAEIRTTTTSPGDGEYAVLCADVTRPADLVRLEVAMEVAGARPTGAHRDNEPGGASELSSSIPRSSEAARPEPRLTGRGEVLDGLVETASEAFKASAEVIVDGRPAVQTASIARQFEELWSMVEREGVGFRPDQPVGIGVSGGRLRLAFMHPDMSRFYGPAWQMALGAGDAAGQEQIVVLAQAADDGRIVLVPFHPQYREQVDAVPGDLPAMHPDESVSDWHSYERFGTSLSEELLRRLGYVDEAVLRELRARDHPMPPPSLWVSANLRRPFPLVANAVASLRTVRDGAAGARVQAGLGRARFRGLRLASTGRIPEGGFASSSAVTVAVLNALNALYELGLPAGQLVQLACQSEYGTGVRAGSLDQATAQLGRAGVGALISSNPRDHYRVFGTHPVPFDRFRVLFPYTVPRDREAWRWSWGFYGETPASGRLTAGEMRKMTGKAAEIAALLARLPLGDDLFAVVQDDLLRDGELSLARRAWVASFLRRVPLRLTRAELGERLAACRPWLVGELGAAFGLTVEEAQVRAGSVIESVMDGWRDPVLRRTIADGVIVEEAGMPLRALVAYLFAEVVRNFHLIRHPDEWIACVTWSQRGDRCVDIDPARLPERGALETIQSWEREVQGPARLDRWLERLGATPFDFNRGLDDAALATDPPPDLHRLPGANFFRGLALVDLAEAMLQRAFGPEAVAVRVNAAGQGDYFQVHVDRERAEPEVVKAFLRAAFYRRFDLAPEPEFVEVHPGGPAVGVRLERYDALPELARALRRLGTLRTVGDPIFHP